MTFNVTPGFDVTGDGDVLYASPQLFFRCTGTLCPTGAMEDTSRHKEFSVIFFSALYARQFPAEEGFAHAIQAVLPSL